jgi:hypothetical protein
VLSKINPFGIRAIAGNPKLDPEKPAAGGSCDINVNHSVVQFKIVQGRRPTVQKDGFAALIFNYLGLSFQIPARGVWGNGERLRCLGMSRRRDENCKNKKSEMSKHDLWE